MVVNTRIFGEVTVGDDRLLQFPAGIIGFPELKNFAIIHDAEEDSNGGIRWMQSFDEPAFAMPVIDPLTVCDEYNPQVDDELLKIIGGIDDILVLVTITVPSDLTKMSVNLKAPIIINVAEKKACQVILDQDYSVKHYIYDILKARKDNMAKAGE